MATKLELNGGNRIWVTSDTHFGHGNIMRFCKRVWLRKTDLDQNGRWISTKVRDERCEEMNEGLISNWNSVVRPEDVILHLGDFSYGVPKQYLERLNGEIHLVMGNHDKQYRVAGFASIHEGICELTVKAGKIVQKVFLCHYPCLTWNGRKHGRPHLFGHVHSSPHHQFRGAGKSYDVGVDNNQYRPILLEDALVLAEVSAEMPGVPDNTDQRE